MKKLFLLLLLLPLLGRGLGGGLLSAQNVTVSNLVVTEGPPSTVTFDVSWERPSPGTVWMDSAWVFVDYNKNGVMARLPLLLSSGATLTDTSAPGEGRVEEEPGNTKGMWVRGYARGASGSFSASVLLLTDATNIAGACAYASGYPPVGEYLDDAKLQFSGTPWYKIWLNSASGPEMIETGSLFFIPCGYTIDSFTDSTGAPGIFNCIRPTIHTLSGADVCEGAAVDLTLSGSQSGWKYQLYNGDAPVGAPKDGTGSALAFTGETAVGGYTYTVRTVGGAGVRCDMPVSNTLNLTVNPQPAGLSLVTTFEAAAICLGQSATLTASMTPISGASYSINNSTWHTTTAFNVTPTSNESYTLYVKTAAGCTASLPNAVTIMVNPVPTNLTLTPSVPITCAGQTVTLTASASVTAGASYSINNSTWQTTTTFSVAPTTGESYPLYVKSTAGCVGSVSKALTLTVNSLPTAPVIAKPANVCFNGGSIVFTATNYSGRLTWAATGGGTESGNSVTFANGAATGTKTVSAYASQTHTGAPTCYSATVTQTATVNPAPDVPTNPSANSRCGNGTVTVSATVPGGNTIDWYDAPSGGSTVAVGVTSFTPSITSSRTYHAQARSTAGCVSTSRLPVGATRANVPDPPSISANSSYCTAGTITATPGYYGTGIRWDNGSTNAAREITATDNYSAVSTSAAGAGCTSTITQVTVTINMPGTLGNPAAPCGCAAGMTECKGTCLYSSCNFTYCDSFTEITVGNGYNDELFENMSWASATLTCRNIDPEGNIHGYWRLPTVSEFECMCANRSRLPGYYVQSNAYWTSDVGTFASTHRKDYYFFWPYYQEYCKADDSGLPSTAALYFKCVR